jgi:hypothetical protein
MALAPNIDVVFYCMYGHLDTMAEAIAAGSGQAGNIEVTPVQVAELVPHEVLEESGAKAARAALPRASGQVAAVGCRRRRHLDALMAIMAILNDDKSSKHLGGVFRSEVVEFGDMPTQPQKEMVMEDSHKHSINKAGQSASVGLTIRPKEPTKKATLSRRRRRARTSKRSKKAAAGALVLLSQDEARFSMIPTLRTTLGVKGHRPLVGTLDGHEAVDVFGALNLVIGQLTTRLVARLQQAKKPGSSTQRSWQAGCARHRRDMARAYPAAPYPQVVIV